MMIKTIATRVAEREGRQTVGSAWELLITAIIALVRELQICRNRPEDGADYVRFLCGPRPEQPPWWRMLARRRWQIQVEEWDRGRKRLRLQLRKHEQDCDQALLDVCCAITAIEVEQAYVESR